MSVTSYEELNSLYERDDKRIYKGYLMPINYDQGNKIIEELEVYDDDVWVCGFPKSGTTWTQEMVWCISNNLDFAGSKVQMEDRFVYLELSHLIDIDGEEDLPDFLLKSVDVVKNMKRPRFIKSHLPWHLMPKQITSFERRPKIIYVVRNPMDTAVSFQYFNRMLGITNDDMKKTSQKFLEDNVLFSPYDDHVLSYWNKRHQPNILCIKYEDMKTQLSSVIYLVAEFLEKTIPCDGKDKLIRHLSFNSMKKQQNIAPNKVIKYLQMKNKNYDKDGEFMRSGKSGGYRFEMSEKDIDLFKKRFIDKFEKAGLKFPI